jgi:hypothetical protein
MRQKVPPFLAAHEAGHAVALLVLGQSFSHIEVGFDMEDKVCGRVERSKGP